MISVISGLFLISDLSSNSTREAWRHDMKTNTTRRSCREAKAVEAPAVGAPAAFPNKCHEMSLIAQLDPRILLHNLLFSNPTVIVLAFSLAVSLEKKASRDYCRHILRPSAHGCFVCLCRGVLSVLGHMEGRFTAVHVRRLLWTGHPRQRGRLPVLCE